MSLNRSQQDEAKRLFAEGLTQKEIAKRFHVSPSRVYYALATAGVELQRRSRVLSEETECAIAAAYVNKGTSSSALAEHYGVGHATILRTLDRRGVEKRQRGWGKTPTDRRCSTCHEVKPLGAFDQMTTRPEYHGRTHRCRECRSRIHRERGYSLKNNTGLTLAQYDELLERQRGVCAICGQPPKKLRLSVDHDHATGMIRGLLCHGCNTRMCGLDDAEWLAKAHGYLARPHTGLRFRSVKRQTT